LPGRREALHAAALFTRIGHKGTVATPSGGPTAQVDNQFSIVELRIGGRYFFGNTQRGQRLFAGFGATFGYALDYKLPTLIYYDASQHTLAGSEVPEAYPHSSLIPYLEVGVEQGRLSLTLDARTQQRQEVYRLASYPAQPQSGHSYTFSDEDYTYRNWYLGATLGFALLRKQ
jgi:hypothetical protein